MTTGQFMSFLVSLLLAYQPVKALGNLNISVQEGLAGAERIFLLLDTSKDKSEKHLESKNINLDGNIEFNNINFSFEENNVLKSINLTIESGKKTAFVGLSGSGKSTLINLLLRFYDNYTGHIKIDNHDIKSMSLFDLRENISLITQETLLFNESILDNIRYGNMSSDDKEIEEISRLSGVSKFADQLPEKLHTVVGESGIKLSGGQRQRIAIARALIKNAPILVMDEATSSLDNLTEREIQKALDELMKDKTTIIIAHRLSTIKDADIIFTIDNGKIENKGNHEHLMENSAVYKKLQLQENSNEN
jgi:subfamily B ATP-binding cassette protein MsbA